MSRKPAAIEVAREVDRTEPGRIVIRQGVRARLVAVPEGILEATERKIEDPPVPMVVISEEGREIPNPDDPAYLAQLEKNQSLRGKAAVDAMCLFGVELLDGLPEDNTWEKKLKFMESRGSIDLGDLDWDDPFELEFIFVRYAMLTMADVSYLGKISRMTQEELAAAEASFQR